MGNSNIEWNPLTLTAIICCLFPDTPYELCASCNPKVIMENIETQKNKLKKQLLDKFRREEHKLTCNFFKVTGKYCWDI